MARSKKKPDLETADREELLAYIKRLEASRDQMQANNKAVTKFAGKVNEAVTRLATDGSLVFQAMAEKAGVRGHPSVTKVVEFFDTLMHQQWRDEGIPDFEFPEDWDFDDENQWSGDADMQLNAPIAELIDIIESMRFSSKLSAPMWSALTKAVGKVEEAMRTHIAGIKTSHGFVTKTVDVSDAPHGIGWALLDLAQDMKFANHMLRRDLRASVYRRVCADLYQLSQAEFAEGPGLIDIKVLGGERQPF